MAIRKGKKGQAARRVAPEAMRIRLQRWLPFPLAILVSGLALFGLAHANVKIPEPGFPIVTLQIESSFTRIESGRIADVVAPLVAGGFFDTDVNAVKEAVTELPWVRDAGVRRVWPGTLHIAVVEQHAIARWGDEGLLNAEGELFRPPHEESHRELPLLEGPPRTMRQVINQHRELDVHLAPLGLAVERLSMDPRRAWRATLDNGVTLVLGRKDAGHQVERFARHWSRVMAARAGEIEEVDLRYPNGFAVRWNETGDSV